MNGTTQWTIDQGHSELQFKIRHLAITNVTGKFKLFQGNVTTTNEDFDNAVVKAEFAGTATGRFGDTRGGIRSQGQDRPQRLRFGLEYPRRERSPGAG